MTIYCADCGGELEGKAHFDEDDDRGLWLWCRDCDQSGDFAPEDVEQIDRGRGAATDGGEVTDGTPQGDREAIQQHIVESMRSPDGADEELESDSIVCPSCAQEVDTTIEHVVHRVPDHGEDDIKNVIYCSHSCFSDHMDFLFSGGENDAQ